RPRAVPRPQPAGRLQPTIPALQLRESRLTLGLDRGATLTFGGYELGAHLTVSGIRRESWGSSFSGEFLRPSAVLNLQKPFGSTRILFHTIAAGVFSHD